MFAKEGLAGVVAARTSICLIKGDEGTLTYRGYPIHDLAEKACFEEVAYLLWYGELPARKELSDFASGLRACRNPPRAALDALRGPLRAMHPMDALRTAVSMLAAEDPEVDDVSEASNLRKGLRITASMPTLVAAHERLRNGLEPAAPDQDLGHAENFLYMMTGRRPDKLRARALDCAMILQADHGFNASTFAARVTAGTLSDLHSAVISAIATLKGPLHGGASRQVLEMLAAIGDKSKAKDFVDAALAAKKKIPGLGHRIYNVMDPRAIELRRICKTLAGAGGASRLFDIASAVEELACKRRGLYPNVDFYAAPVYHLLGLPPDQFAAVFACSRIAGWVAHVIEQHLDNRLIRPLEEYIGPLTRPFVPIGERG